MMLIKKHYQCIKRARFISLLAELKYKMGESNYGLKHAGNGLFESGDCM